MAYVKNDPPWVEGGAPGISAERLNHMETQYDAVKTELATPSGDLPVDARNIVNDGPGSGLDADLLDGLHASEFVLVGNELLDKCIYGDGSDGSLNTTGNITFTVPTEDVSTIVKQYTSIKINAGHTLTVDKRCRGLFLLSRGDVVIDGTINMTGKAANVSPDATPQPTLAFVARPYQVYILPRGGSSGNGGNGGKAGSDTGGAGGFGAAGLWWGGASGGGGGAGSASALNTIGTTVSQNANGGSYTAGNPYGSGGAGAGPVTDTKAMGGYGGNSAGGGGSASHDGTTGSAKGGKGGNGPAGGGGGGAGANNSTAIATDGQQGQAGGGLVVICARGSITINAGGSIIADGGNGGAGGNGANAGSSSWGCGGGGGGGSGGGIIALVYRNSYVNNGTLRANGGQGGPAGASVGTSYAATAGANGSAGSIVVLQGV